jgi:hypothetical protein
MKMFFLLLLLAACSTTSQDKKVLAWEEWKGHSVSELKEHPYFRHLPVNKISHDSGIETWVYQDQARFQTSAYCQSLGGCIGLPSFSCESAFSIAKGQILGLEQKGTCPDVKVIDPARK